MFVLSMTRCHRQVGVPGVLLSKHTGYFITAVLALWLSADALGTEGCPSLGMGFLKYSGKTYHALGVLLKFPVPQLYHEQQLCEKSQQIFC